MMARRGLRSAFEMLAGGFAVYVAMAACSGRSDPGSSEGLHDARGGVGGLPPDDVGGSGGRPGRADAESLTDAFVDSFTARDARAEAGPVEAGIRLRPRHRVTDEGLLHEFLGWYDFQLQAECTFQRAADDVERCLPGSHENSGALIYYLDPLCQTRPIAFQRADSVGCGAPKYFWKRESAAPPSCELPMGRYHVFKVGARVTASTVYAPGLQGCSPQPLEADQTAYELAPMPPAAFVGSTVQIERG